MSQQDNIRAVEKWVEAVNAHDVGQLANYRAAGYSFEVPALPGTVGVDEEAVWTQGLFEAFPDLHIEIAQTIAQNDCVVVNGTCTGTHQGPLVMPTGDSVPPTGKKLAVSVSNTFQLKDGKVARNSIYYDQVAMLGQLGLMPGM